MHTQPSTETGQPRAGGSGRQARVHDLIMTVGGYWPPVNAVARLLEELAEAAELPAGDQELAGELADLWIITTCLASQFNVTVPDPGPAGTAPAAPAAASAGPVAGFTAVIEAAGQLARVVNYYDGPKNPRSAGELPTLRAALPAFQRALAAFAAAVGVDLGPAVDAKTSSAAVTDRGRFPVTPDPLTAPVVARFAAACQPGPLLPRGAAGLWGAPDWEASRSAGHNLERIVPWLTRFAKAAGRESLPGFVIGLPGGPVGDMAATARQFARILTGLAARDPRPNSAFSGDVTEPGWRFWFHAAPLAALVFSPLYRDTSPRYSEQGAFLLLRPATEMPPGDGGAQDCLPPRWPGDAAAAWWEHA